MIIFNQLILFPLSFAATSRKWWTGFFFFADTSLCFRQYVFREYSLVLCRL